MVEPDIRAWGVPRYPGMRITFGSRFAEEGQAGEGEPESTSEHVVPKLGGPRNPVELAADVNDMAVYVSTDKFEDVVDFYETKLRTRPLKTKPVPLAEKYPLTKIPAEAQGRRKTFLIRQFTDPDLRVETPQQMQTWLYDRLRGRVAIVLQDHGLEPGTRRVLPWTTIMIFKYRKLPWPEAQAGESFYEVRPPGYRPDTREVVPPPPVNPGRIPQVGAE